MQSNPAAHSQIDGLVQERRNSSALAMELSFSCTNPSKWFFEHNSYLMEMSFCSHPSYNEVIAMKFCTWHDSYAVMACAIFCCDIISNKGVDLNQLSINFDYDEKNCSWIGSQDSMLHTGVGVTKALSIDLFFGIMSSCTKVYVGSVYWNSYLVGVSVV